MFMFRNLSIIRIYMVQKEKWRKKTEATFGVSKKGNFLFHSDR
jgi:hypothetical protein